MGTSAMEAASEHLAFLDGLRADLTEITEVLLRSEDMHDASTAIAPLLGIDEAEVTSRLNGPAGA
jgi:hypothetical protein